MSDGGFAAQVVQERIIALYRERGAIRTGHFLLASGLHTDTFLQSATVMQYPDVSKFIGQVLAMTWLDLRPGFVIGPAMGGVILAASLAREIEAKVLFAEKDGDRMFVRHGLTITPGETFLAVEDVMTTGASVRKAIEAAESMGAVCAGVSAIIDRSDGRVDFGVPFRPLARMSIEAFAPDECPLCRAGWPPLEKI